MTTTISVSVDEAQLKRLRTSFGKLPHASRVALVRSINRVIGGPKGGIKKVIANEIHAAVKVQKSFIYKQTGKRSERTFSHKKATTADPSGYVSTQGANVPLIYYSNQAGRRKRKSKSIYVTVQRARSRTKLQHAFVATMPSSGHTGIFVRRNPDDPKDRRIRQLYGSRIPDILSNTSVIQKVSAEADRLLYKNLDHELNYLTRKVF